MGKTFKKAIGQDSTPSNKIDSASIHSTPLPAVGNTPDFPSPRGHNAKRKAVGEHELSPSNKAQKRTFESTFTPKMRTRTFSVKRFKRKKSEGKFKQIQVKETFTSYNNEMIVSTPGTAKKAGHKSRGSSSPGMRQIQTRSVTAGTTPNVSLINDDGMDVSSKVGEDLTDSKENEDFEEQYAEVKAQFLELEQEVDELERTTAEECINERFEAACAAGNLARESRETARQMARVRRSSSCEKKPRSPSQRRIGVIRRRSREREQKMSASASRPLDVSPEPRAPNVKPCLTPLNLDKPSFKSKLQRGQPNSTTVGLEKPLPSPVLDTTSGKARIKMSFKERDRPKVIIPTDKSGSLGLTSPLKKSPCEKKLASSEKKKLSHGDSIASLKNDIRDMIEKSFGSGEKEDIENDDVFNTTNDKSVVNDLSSKIENISFRSESPLKPLDDFFNQSSPVTRSQLRRVSDCFEFARPETVSTSNDRTDSLRRQSSAFEFRSKFASEGSDVSYENLTRDAVTRGSLRRRNSSVRDLVKKIESETRKRSIGSQPEAAKPVTRGSIGSNSSNPSNMVKPTSQRVVPDIKVDVSRLKPLRISEDNEEFTDGWVDASEFFKNVTQAEAPQCGRSSIVKIRTQNQGRVKDSVTKFSQPGATPVR